MMFPTLLHVAQMPDMTPLLLLCDQAPIVPMKHGKSTLWMSPTQKKRVMKDHSLCLISSSVVAESPFHAIRENKIAYSVNEIDKTFRFLKMSPIVPVPNCANAYDWNNAVSIAPK